MCGTRASFGILCYIVCIKYCTYTVLVVFFNIFLEIIWPTLCFGHDPYMRVRTNSSGSATLSKTNLFLNTGLVSFKQSILTKLKVTVQRKLTWVKSGINRKLMILAGAALEFILHFKGPWPLKFKQTFLAS
jgi:hypothetical protein